MHLPSRGRACLGLVSQAALVWGLFPKQLHDLPSHFGLWALHVTHLPSRGLQAGGGGKQLHHRASGRRERHKRHRDNETQVERT